MARILIWPWALGGLQAKLLHELNHPNILHLHEAFIENQVGTHQHTRCTHRLHLPLVVAW
jgi:hypothetical protein